MQARNFVASALLAVGVLMAGCGGAGVEAEAPADLTSREDALPDCTGLDYEYMYYSDPAKTNVVGGRGCSCGAWFRWGTTTSYYDYTSGTCF